MVFMNTKSMTNVNLEILNYGRKESEMAETTDTTILADIKSKLGVLDGDDSFDDDLVDNIGMAISELYQLGIGRDIEVTKDTKYSEFFIPTQSNQTKMLAKSFIKLSVKLIFDTPASGAANTNDNAALAQVSWRIGISVTNIDDPNREHELQ